MHESTSNYIPCLYVRNEISSRLLLYFHGKAEDLEIAKGQVLAIADYCNVSVLAIEYPGYGTYAGNGEATEEKKKEDAEHVYRFCL